MTKTIPQLQEFTTSLLSGVLPLDNGTQTGKMTLLNLRNLLIPPGVVSDFAGESIPDGFLLCDGSVVSRLVYANLFAAIGVRWGAGDGSTTFQLPDFRGRVAIGRDDMGGAAAGRITIALSGIDGNTVGAAGGAQSIIPSGSIGGNQSIAHTHNISHVHQWARSSYGSGGHRTLSGLTAVNAGKTTIALGTDPNVGVDNEFGTSGAGISSYGFGTRVGPTDTSSVNLFTTGALSAPGGTSGAGAASGPVSANETVQGSNFSFSGVAHTNVGPAAVVNKIIKF